MMNNLKLNREQQEREEVRQAAMRFRRNIDKMLLEKYPKIDFALHTDNVEVLAAYEKLNSPEPYFLYRKTNE